MQRDIVFSVFEYYHIYNRGVDKRDIFLDQDDYIRFQNLLFLCNSEKSVVMKQIKKGEIFDFDRGNPTTSIGSYCLMPNHFHLLVKEIKEGGISLFMKKVTTAYSMYFNKKYERSGALFEGNFKAVHASRDEYLKYLFSYIHLNPVKLIELNWKKEGIKNQDRAEQFLSKYKFSSYLDYIKNREKIGMILDKKEFPEYFSSQKDFHDTVKFWLNFRDAEIIQGPTLDRREI